MAFAGDDFFMDSFFTMQNGSYLAALGLGLMVLEFILPTKGLLGLAGVAFFTVGTFSLAENPNPHFRLTWMEIILLNILVVGTFLAIIYATVKAYRQEHPEITEDLLNHEAVVIEWNDERKRVEVGGAIWNAKSDTHNDFVKGDKVIVKSQNNLFLIVTPVITFQGE